MLDRNTPYPFLPALFLEITRDVVGVKRNTIRISSETSSRFSAVEALFKSADQ
jgi:hypothetical protein